MNLFKFFGLVALVLVSASADPKHYHGKALQYNTLSSSDGGSMKPSDWFPINELQTLPSTEEITLQKLESMPVEEGQRLIQKIYHLSQINHSLKPSFVPSPSNVPVIFVKPNGQHEESTLSQMVAKAKNQPKFGDEEVTIFITGVPESASPAVTKANKKLVQAYMERYCGQQRPSSSNKQDYEQDDKEGKTSSEEDLSESWKEGRHTGCKGDLVIIALGSTLNSMKRYTQLDVQKTGEMLAKVLVDLTNEADVPQETIHLIGQGMGAHVAGVAGRKFKQRTGHQIRRITALDAAKLYATDKNILTGLARGDADFVDAIHTNPRGLGTRTRVGDVDFYVNGPSGIAPGTDNVVEASMRATRYFAESLRPGMERNFPAVPANSMRQYESKEGMGKRAYMGIDTDYDLKGDYILDVNAKSPFGKTAPAEKQRTYHDLHKAWRTAEKKGMEYY